MVATELKQDGDSGDVIGGELGGDQQPATVFALQDTAAIEDSMAALDREGLLTPLAAAVRHRRDGVGVPLRELIEQGENSPRYFSAQLVDFRIHLAQAQGIGLRPREPEALLDESETFKLKQQFDALVHESTAPGQGTRRLQCGGG